MVSPLRVAQPLGSSAPGPQEAIHVIDGRIASPPNVESILQPQYDIWVCDGEWFHETMISPFDYMRKYLCRHDKIEKRPRRPKSKMVEDFAERAGAGGSSDSVNTEGGET